MYPARSCATRGRCWRVDARKCLFSRRILNMRSFKICCPKGAPQARRTSWSAGSRYPVTGPAWERSPDRTIRRSKRSPQPLIRPVSLAHVHPLIRTHVSKLVGRYAANQPQFTFPPKNGPRGHSGLGGRVERSVAGHRAEHPGHRVTSSSVVDVHRLVNCCNRFRRHHSC